MCKVAAKTLSHTTKRSGWRTKRKKSNPVSFDLLIISAIKLSEFTATSLNLQGREILKNIQKERDAKWK